MDQVEFRLLGPFEVRSGQRMILSGGGKRRAVLAVLLLSANEAVSVERLIDALWGETAPSSAVNLVQGYVSDLRRILEPDRPPRASGQRLVSSHGYRLVVSKDECDLMRFDALLGKARSAQETGDLSAASGLLSRALGEWRGAPLLDFTAEQFTSAASTRLQEARLSAVEAAAEVELSLGRPDRALCYLLDLSDAHPFRERLAELRILALYRSGRQADALAVYETTRLGLADELGVDPGPALRKLHLEMLRQEPSLVATAPPVIADVLPALPVALSSFVGRERELESVLQMLGSHRLVTLTGPGGSGKTRLATEAGTVVRAAGEREVAFVDLTPVRAARLVGAAIADACRLRVRPDLAAVASLAAQLAGRRVLLVLDNAEHVLDAVPDIAALLASAPGVAVLATSREPLGLEGERQFPVHPLALPAQLPGASVQDVLGSDAVRLFLDRARAANPGFSVADRDAAALAGVCRRLDGLPLALELAAPWTKTLTLRALLERLDRSLELLVGATRHGPERHRSLRTAIEWSYAALSHPERQLLQALSIFASGAPLDAVEAVAPLPGGECLPALAALIDKSLVVRAGVPQQPRYRLLETIREYAAQRLATDAEAAHANRARHAQYYCLVAEQAGRAAHTAAGEATAFRLAEEAVEIRTALDYLSGTGSSEAALALAIDCLPLWWDLGHIEEGYRHLTERLNASDDKTSPPLLQAAASAGAAILAEAKGDSDAAVALARSAGRLAAEAGAQTLQALALAVEGDVSMWGDSQTQALERLHEAIDLASLAPDGPARWAGRAGRGDHQRHAVARRDLPVPRSQARPRAAQASVEGRHRPAPRILPAACTRFPRHRLRELSGCRKPAPEIARRCARTRSGRSQSRSHEGLAALAWARGALVTAAAEAEHALRISRDAGHAYNWGRCAALLADVLIEQGDITRARHVLGTAISAIEGQDRDFALRVLSPRQARAARLSGRTTDAAAALARAKPVQHPDQLAPERVVYLVEDALASLGNRDHVRAGHLISDLIAQAARLGLVIPLPERNRINALLLSSASGAHGSSK